MSDLHRYKIDDLTIPSQQGKAVRGRLTIVGVLIWKLEHALHSAELFLREQIWNSGEGFSECVAADFVAEGMNPLHVIPLSLIKSHFWCLRCLLEGTYSDNGSFRSCNMLYWVPAIKVHSWRSQNLNLWAFLPQIRASYILWFFVGSQAAGAIRLRYVWVPGI